MKYTFRVSSRRGVDQDFVKRGLNLEQLSTLITKALSLGLQPWMTMTVELDPDSPTENEQ